MNNNGRVTSEHVKSTISVQVPEGMKISFRYSTSMPKDFIGIQMVPNKNKIWWKFWQRKNLYYFSYFEPI